MTTDTLSKEAVADQFRQMRDRANDILICCGHSSIDGVPCAECYEEARGIRECANRFYARATQKDSA